jgi:UPF0716 protein FxsA
VLWKVILVLTVVPLLELYVLVKLTQATSFLVTVLVVLASAVIGVILAKMEGMRVLRRMQEELAQGRIPGDRILDGLLILMAAVLFVIPGLLTDAVAFLLLLPPTRALARMAVKWWMKRKLERGRLLMYTQMGFGPIRGDASPQTRCEDDDSKDSDDSPATPERLLPQ